MFEKATLDPPELDAILRETHPSISVGVKGKWETGVFLGSFYLGHAERRPMARRERIERMPSGYPYRIAAWPGILQKLCARLPERHMAQRMVRAANRRGFSLALPRKWA